jgi:hypothetical protein
MVMDIYTLVATVSLVLQIVILILLSGSLELKRRKKFRHHGITMLTAVVLHTISIVAVMIPSFRVITAGDFTVFSLIAYVHGAAGALAELLAIWILVTWRLRTSIQYCAPKKKLMLLTLSLWLTAIVLGILLYLYYYTTLLV